MFIKTVRQKTRTYIELVESERSGAKVRQKHIAYLGSVEADKLSLLKIADSIRKHCAGDSYVFGSGILLKASEYGRVLICERLFKESGLEQFIGNKIASTKRNCVSMAHIKSMIYNRLCDPRSKLSLLRWLEDVHLSGISVPEEITMDEQKLFANICYMNMDFLWTYKKQIEDLLFGKVKTLFDEIEIVMYDLTSTYFEGEGPAGLGDFGHSRDEKKRNKQIVIGVVMANGFPIAHEIFRGNMLDVKTLQTIVDTLKKRFKIKRIVFVADAGLLSQENTEYLEKNGYEYILCCRRRRSEDWKKLFAGWEKDAKEIQGGADRKKLLYCERKEGRTRIILCKSDARREYETQMREGIMKKVQEKLEKLERSVKEGRIKQMKAIVRRAEQIMGCKRGHWYFEYKAANGKFQWFVNTSRLEDETFIEGKFFLRTNNKDMSAAAITRTYKDLWRIERGFRTLKDFIEVRPVFHWLPRRVKCHVFICVLAQFLERLLQLKINGANKKLSAQRALYHMKSVRIGQIKDGDQIIEKVTLPGPIQQAILNVTESAGTQ